jgi:metal-dependent amidase/aminoacylase/carboxypeptidase family protein
MRTAEAHGVAVAVERLEPELIALRRDLHRHPELGFAEVRTASVVAERLRSFGLTVRTEVGGTGVLADLVGEEPGPTLLIRADMDALPVTEATGLEFASVKPGVMHACGHDGHVAALIGAARVLMEMRSNIAGTVRFCFQPAEELLAGAPRMIAEARWTAWAACSAGTSWPWRRSDRWSPRPARSWPAPTSSSSRSSVGPVTVGCHISASTRSTRRRRS